MVNISKNQVCVLSEIKFMFQRIEFKFQRIKFSFCRNQVCFAEIKITFQIIKFAFYRNQIYVSKNQVRKWQVKVKQHISHDQSGDQVAWLTFQRIKFGSYQKSSLHLKESSLFCRNQVYVSNDQVHVLQKSRKGTLQ